MTKLGVAFWVGLVVATGFTTFKVKYAVQDIETCPLSPRRDSSAGQGGAAVRSAARSRAERARGLRALRPRRAAPRAGAAGESSAAGAPGGGGT